MLTRKQFEKFLSITVEYLPNILTIGFSVYIVLLSQTVKMSSDELLVWVLSLLGLLATSGLVERMGKLHRIEQFTESTHNYLIKREAKPSLDFIFQNRKSLPPLETRLQSAKEIVIAGGSLSRIVNEYLGYFEHKLQEGCNLKFLLIQPGSEAAKLVAEYVVYEVTDPLIYEGQIQNSLDTLYRLKQRYSNLVDIRTYQSVPPFGLLIIDPTKAHGSIQVELYTYAIPTRDRPEFIVQSSREPYWYKFFLEQFNQMWNQAKPWQPQQQSSSSGSPIP